jgi:hypothetical protein
MTPPPPTNPPNAPASAPAAGGTPPTITIRCTPDLKDLPITNVPAMPTILLQAVVTGATPVAPASTTFEWTVTLTFTPTDCKHGQKRPLQPIVLTETNAGTYTPRFTAIRGGKLNVKVKANVNGADIAGERTDLRIVGTNPTYAQLTAAIASKVFRALVWHESSGGQFLGTSNGGTSACPKFSGDGKGGVGLTQLTNPAPTENQIWDWTANLAGGQALFEVKKRGARAYPGNVRKSVAFIKLVSDYNTERVRQKLAELRITLPDFTADQIDLDALRGFNGWAGGMHEYRVVKDTTGKLVVALGIDGKTGTASWEQVPAADRPASGDRNYVATIMGANVPF